jgi:hypothetical protein
MLKKKLLGSLVLIALVSGCDNDNENEQLPTSLVGTWNSTCVVGEDDDSYMTTYEFTETEVMLKFSNYYDSTCSDLGVELIFSGTYDVGEDILTPNRIDATEIDIILTERTATSEIEIRDVDFTLLDLFVIEGTYLYWGDDSGENGARPTDIDYSYSFEFQD